MKKCTKCGSEVEVRVCLLLVADLNAEGKCKLQESIVPDFVSYYCPNCLETVDGDPEDIGKVSVVAEVSLS